MQALSLKQLLHTVAASSLILTLSGCDLDSSDSDFTTSAQADAGAFQRVLLTNDNYDAYMVSLDGSGSSSSEENENGDNIAAYQWTQVGGDYVELSDSSSATPSFASPSSESTLEFELLVVDHLGQTDVDTTIVFANIEPISIETDQVIGEIENVCASFNQDEDGDCI